MWISNDDIQRMKEVCEGENIIAYCDGACIGNPGPAGCSAIFKKVKYRRGAAFSASDSDMDIEDKADEVDMEFLFGTSIHIGMNTNNVAEYVAIF